VAYCYSRRSRGFTRINEKLHRFSFGTETHGVLMAYSTDLRKVALKAYNDGKVAVHDIAKIYGVSIATLYRWRELEWETKSLEKRKHGGGRPARIDEEGLEVVKELIKNQSDLRLLE
jgi:transposase